MRAGDRERIFQCFTCKFTEICNLDENAEDERGLCKQYRKNEYIAQKISKLILNGGSKENELV